MVTVTLGDWVRQRRKALKMSQATLAKRMDYDKSYISHIEMNRAKRASYGLLLQLAEALEVPIEAMLADTGLTGAYEDADKLAPAQERIIGYTRARLAHLTSAEAEQLIRIMEAAYGEKAPD